MTGKKMKKDQNLTLQENELLKEFREQHKDEIEYLNPHNIQLHYRVHHTCRTTFRKLSDEIRLNTPDFKVKLPLIVRKVNESYYLISGYKMHRLALNLHLDTVPCIIISEPRKDFFAKLGITSTIHSSTLVESSILLSEIRIPERFKNTLPREEKLDLVRNYYQEHNCLDKPIYVSRNNILRDGYTRYLVAKELQLNTVPVIFNSSVRNK